MTPDIGLKSEDWCGREGVIMAREVGRVEGLADPHRANTQEWPRSKRETLQQMRELCASSLNPKPIVNT